MASSGQPEPEMTRVNRSYPSGQGEASICSALTFVENHFIADLMRDKFSRAQQAILGWLQMNGINHYLEATQAQALHYGRILGG